MNEASISLKTLFENRTAYDDVVDLEFARVYKTEDDGIEWFDLYNESNSLACMDGETVFYCMNENNECECWNDEGETITKFKLTEEEFDEAFYR